MFLASPFHGTVMLGNISVKEPKALQECILYEALHVDYCQLLVEHQDLFMGRL